MPDYAIYGIHPYGTARYGLPPRYNFSLDYFDVQPVGYDRIKIEWGHPSGDWNLLRLIRGNFGYPTDQTDGRILYEATNVDAGGVPVLPVPPYVVNTGSYEDTNVGELRFHYYSIWLRQTATGDWVRAGNAATLMPKDYGSTERLYELTPMVFRDDDSFFIAERTGVGMLETFLGIFGYQIDTIRAELESLLWTADPEKMSGGLLPALARQLGFPYEAELGMALVRRQLLNAVYLYKMKGTRVGIEGAVTSLTGWPAAATAVPGTVDITVTADRVNLVENPSAEVDNSFWNTGTVNGAVTRSTAQYLYGAAAFQLAITATLATGASMQTPAGLLGMPVVPGVTYTGSIYNFKPSGTARNIRPDLLWYDAAGAQIGSPVLGTELTQTINSWANRPSLTATAPPGAATAALRINVLPAVAGQNPGAGENQYFDGAIFERGGLGAYGDQSVPAEGTPIADYLWEGTTHLSASHYYHRRSIKNSRLLVRLPEFLPNGTIFNVHYAQPL